MINRKQFGRILAERYGITYRDSDRLCRNVFELLGNLLYKEKEDVIITGFGSFRHKTAKEKKVRHPGTGEIIITPEREFIKFTPSELLEEKND